jgi:hypothetical protein
MGRVLGFGRLPELRFIVIEIEPAGNLLSTTAEPPSSPIYNSQWKTHWESDTMWRSRPPSTSTAKWPRSK